MKWLRASVAVLAAGFTAPSFAQGWAPFLEDTPMSRFSDRDLAMFAAARTEALEHHRDGSGVAWKNPQTGASGRVTPLDTTLSGGQKCRLLHIVNRTPEETGDSRFWFCHTPDGSWKVTSPPPGKSR